MTACFTKIEVEDTASDRAIEKAILEVVKANPLMNQKQVIETVKPELQAGVNRLRAVYNRLKTAGRLKCQGV